MIISNVHRLYISNFLTGLVFWYGIEKLFMQSIGIDAIGIVVTSALITTFLVIFDIPFGILADKWSRKGVLVISAVALAISSYVLGSSKGLEMYIVGSLFYGLYIVCASGTYDAIMYDTLHEEGKSTFYSKFNGRAYGLFLAGAGVGNIASGFLSHYYSYSTAYYLTIISCVLNIVVMLSIREPTFHKTLHKERILHQIGIAALSISKIKLLRTMTIILSMLSVVELFKLDFGQLYMLRYLTSPETIGILWAIYAFAMTLGSLIAHRFRTRLNILIVFTSVPYILMAFIDSPVSIVLFMLQAVAAAALINQIQTRIQENTQSSVRASVMSLISTLGRIIAIPASFGIAWLFRDYNALVVVRSIAILLTAMLMYWLWASIRMSKASPA